MDKTESQIVALMREWLDEKVKGYCDGSESNWLKTEEVLAEITQILGEEE